MSVAWINDLHCVHVFYHPRRCKCKLDGLWMFAKLYRLKINFLIFLQNFFNELIRLGDFHPFPFR